MVGILCGPVVGHVTSNSAKVLLEVDTATAVRGVLEPKGTNDKVIVEKQMVARKPTVFAFDGLKSNTRYKIYASGVIEDALGEFSTFPDDIVKMNIAVFSCDRPSYDAKVGMYDKLKARILKDPIHLVLHIGDNVYMDEGLSLTNEEIAHSDKLFDPSEVDQSIPYVKARSLLRNVPKEEWTSFTDEILEIYRDKYRKVWSLSNRSYILSHTSNLMILDDHEVRDDIGEVNPDDSDPESKEFFLAGLAIHVYHEYQRQLWDPKATDHNRDLFSEFYTMQYDGIGIMMMDSRAARSVYKPLRSPGDDSYYGEKQTQEMHYALRNTENGVKLWLLVSTLPLMFLKRKITKLIGSLIADDYNAFINVHHDDDLVPILEDIRYFKKKKSAANLPGDVLILSGDVHMGGFTDIHFDGGTSSDLLCRQLCTSAIHNEEKGLVEFTGLRTLLRFTEKYGDFSYHHYDWTRKCNFSVLKIEDTGSQLFYTAELVDEDGSVKKESKTEDWSAEPGCCPCCIFL